MKALKRIILSSLVIFFSALMIKLTLPYFTFETDVDFLLTKQSILYNKIWLASFYLHIGASPFILLAGIIQFNDYLLHRFKKLHRLVGKLYVLLILCISAPSGLVMAFYANGGWPAKISFIILSLLWWFFTWKSFSEIKNKNIPAHRAYMIRSYALTLSAITLRIYTFLFPQFFHINGILFYILVSWLSWVPNLLIAERMIRRRDLNSDC